MCRLEGGRLDMRLAIETRDKLVIRLCSSGSKFEGGIPLAELAGGFDLTGLAMEAAGPPCDAQALMAGETDLENLP
jgi:hypothetical protein